MRRRQRTWHVRRAGVPMAEAQDLCRALRIVRVGLLCPGTPRQQRGRASTTLTWRASFVLVRDRRGAGPRGSSLLYALGAAAGAGWGRCRTTGRGHLVGGVPGRAAAGLARKTLALGPPPSLAGPASARAGRIQGGLPAAVRRRRRPGSSSGTPRPSATCCAAPPRVGQCGKLRRGRGEPDGPGSTRNTTRTASAATSMRLTGVQMMSRCVDRSAASRRSRTISANRPSLPMIS